jgi:WLM domain
MDASSCVALIVVIILLVLWRNNDRRETIRVAGRGWNVLSDYDNAAAAAVLLEHTHAKMIRFLAYVKDKYHVNETDEEIADCETHPHDSEPRRIITALLDNYNPDVFYENRPGTNGTSYTINKGSAMYICLRNKIDQNKLVDPDMLMYVMLHEASHIANYNGWGHDQRFWEVFKFILQNAKESGAYMPVDYSRAPEDYCGMRVNYSPIFDAKLRDIDS